MTGWDDDAYDAYLDDPRDYEATQRAAEEPPDWYLEEEAERQAQRHRDEVHFGEACTCPPYQPPPCRLLLRIPRWSPRKSPRKGWHCGTPGLCAAWGQTPRGAWRVHRSSHESPF